MNISRVHILILAIISIATGIIAPAVSNGSIFQPYSLTNLQYASHALAISISILFLVACLQWKKTSHIFAAIAIICIISLFMLTIAGLVKTFSGIILQQLQWGWYFFGTGAVLLVYSLLSDKISQPSNFFKKYGIFVGIIGSFGLGFASYTIIQTSLHLASQHYHTSTLSKIFPEQIQTHGNITTTQAFDDIRFFSIDRSNDIVSFVGTKNGKSTLYPSGTPVENLEEIEDIRTVNGVLYIILKNGIVTQDGNIIGTIFREHSQNEFLMIMDFDNKLRIYSNKHSFVFPVEQENIHHVYIDTGTNNVYWRADTTNGQAVFKNGKQLSGEYPSILRYAISAEGDIMYITENETRDAKFVLKNGVVIHTIHDEYIRGSLQMNGTDVIYLILNPDDSTISVVVNGAILEQKFDTVSHVFLSDNSSSYLYFAQLPNEDKFCVFGRYNGSVCELDAYMNPAVEGDGKGIVYAGVRAGKWSIFRDLRELIKDIGYGKKADISYDYFFFDTANPRYFAFAEKIGNNYQINKGGKLHTKKWQSIDMQKVFFGYDNTIFFVAKDEEGWKVVEME